MIEYCGLAWRYGPLGLLKTDQQPVFGVFLFLIGNPGRCREDFLQGGKRSKDRANAAMTIPDLSEGFQGISRVPSAFNPGYRMNNQTGKALFFLMTDNNPVLFPVYSQNVIGTGRNDVQSFSLTYRKGMNAVVTSQDPAALIRKCAMVAGFV